MRKRVTLGVIFRRGTRLVQFHDHWYYGLLVLLLQPEGEEEEI